jgi:hypothetical protein
MLDLGLGIDRRNSQVSRSRGLLRKASVGGFGRKLARSTVEADMCQFRRNCRLRSPTDEAPHWHELGGKRMCARWKVCLTFLVAATVLGVPFGSRVVDAQGPPTGCYASVTSSSVPGATGPTWNATGGFYTYVWNWTVNFTCSAGQVPHCYICEEVQGQYSLDGNNPWTSFSDLGTVTANQTCGLSYLTTWTTTLNAIPGAVYDIEFTYDAFTENEVGGCGGNGYTLAKMVTVAVPD